MNRNDLVSAIERTFPNSKYYTNVDGINLPFFINAAIRFLWMSKTAESADTELIRTAAKLLDNPGFIEFDS